jgi:hypothetical protein
VLALALALSLAPPLALSVGEAVPDGEADAVGVPEEVGDAALAALAPVADVDGNGRRKSRCCFSTRDFHDATKPGSG